MKNNTCPCCYSTNLSVFYKKKNVPAHSVLLFPTHNTAVDYPKGDIVLGFCKDCGFINNLNFNPDLHKYSESYEETQGFSPTFSKFSKKLCADLIDRYNLRGKTILEIGCGKGEFLHLLCEMGDNRGIGFDPAYVIERDRNRVQDRLTFITDFYSTKYSHYKADFVCCKMTLEHIQQPSEFVQMVRNAIDNKLDTIVFFQIPDVTRILENCSFEDIYYEHCSYFSPGSLGRLFRKCGFDVARLNTEYGGQYLMIDGKPSNGKPTPPLPEEDDLRKLTSMVEYFPQKYEEKVTRWTEQIKQSKQDRKRAVLWGSGSKAVAFLSTLHIRDEINYVVDINPYRQGTYMAGTGHEIVSPDFLKKYKPDVVIIMNAVYKEEIRRDLTQMDLSPEIHTL